MKGIPGTPCCVQMSHALNMCGVPIPSHSYRRHPNPMLPINAKKCFYLLATDELEDSLQTLFGEPETINIDLNKTRSAGEIKKYIKDRPGILIFRHAKLRVVPPQGKFEHTEIWDGTQILQRDMDELAIFSSPRVLMWDTNDPAKFLVDYMQTQS
ncbi:MAG: T6SS effector amidase Tae4 family protein [Granulicella sp.]